MNVARGGMISLCSGMEKAKVRFAIGAVPEVLSVALIELVEMTATLNVVVSINSTTVMQTYWTSPTMSIIAQQLGRTVYYMLKRKEAFNPDKFYGDKKIENKDSDSEHLAYVASRRLHERKLFKSPLSRLAHN